MRSSLYNNTFKLSKINKFNNLLESKYLGLGTILKIKPNN